MIRLLAFLVVLLLPMVVSAQGVGIWMRTDCTTLTSAVAGQTVCWDATAYRWRVWDGTRNRDSSFQIASNGVYFDSVGAATAANNAIIVRMTNTDASTTPIEVLRISSTGAAYLKATGLSDTPALSPLSVGGALNTIISDSSSPAGLVLRNLGSAGVGHGTTISMYGNTVAVGSVNESQYTVLNTIQTSSVLEGLFRIGIRLSDATVTGTLATTAASTGIVGTGTAFESEFVSGVGEQMVVTFAPVAGACTGGTQTVTVATTTDNTNLTTSENLNQTCTAATATKVAGVLSRYTFAGQGTAGTAARQAGLLIGNLDGLVPAEPLHVIANTAATGIRLQRLADTARAWSWRIQSNGDLLLRDVTGSGDRINVAASTGIVSFSTAVTMGGTITLNSVTQANLGTPANGTLLYCSDCTTASACTGGGGGALASRQGGAWKCL